MQRDGLFGYTNSDISNCTLSNPEKGHDELLFVAIVPEIIFKQYYFHLYKKNSASNNIFH